ncbi:MAG: PAS domain-containing sensor histidine kinase, partial [Rhizobiaceae bacterium]|nr:PAS domain-containing sensor histidine kinase [Rhizobiaceae bacterium]
MVEPAYSFLDVAILDEVRERFAAGDALVILSKGLEEIIWANGPGARFLGYPDIASALGEPAGLAAVARRQIMATRGYPDIGSARPMLMRLASGLSSQAVPVLASALHLPDGESAILLAVPLAAADARVRAESAARVASGFAGHGQFAAVLDAEGRIEAATPGFDSLAVESAVLRELTAVAATEDDRLVKRMIRSGSTLLPAGVARLADEPARYLLVLIDERQTATDSGGVSPTGPASSIEEPPFETAAEPRFPQSAPDTAGENAADPEAAHDTDEAAPSITLDDVEAPAHDSFWPEEAVYSNEAPAPEELLLFSPAPASVESIDPADPAAQDQPQSEQGPVEGRRDDWYFCEPSDPAAAEIPAEPVPESDASAATPEPEPAQVDRSALPLRFVWRTDADGRFSQLSPEFAEAVGVAAEQVVGRSFRNVADAFGLDPDGEIAGLLERRDTWSGRSVLWPVIGADLRVPVDLAALPIYDRNRAFEGFRGFGIARLADAVVDPDAAGMALSLPPEIGSEPQEAEAAEPEDSVPAAPATITDPFEGEVPALTIAPKPDRRQTDKIIRLAEHRPAANDKGLSTNERNAFREIGERLKQDTGAAQADNPAVSVSQNTLAAGGEAHTEAPQAEIEAATPSDVATPPTTGEVIADVVNNGAAEPALDGAIAETVNTEATAEPELPHEATGLAPDVADSGDLRGASEQSAAEQEQPRRPRKLSLFDYAPLPGAEAASPDAEEPEP